MYKPSYNKLMKGLPFYTDGLRFSCVRCSNCCRYESGYVYLSENDLNRLANELKMNLTEFIKTWCRWVPFDNSRDRLSLKEKSNFDCIFWGSSDGKEGCRVYEQRPLQCRAFPFWDHIVLSQEAWKNAGLKCPGIGKGEWHSKNQIDNWVFQTEEEPVIERELPRIGV